MITTSVNIHANKQDSPPFKVVPLTGVGVENRTVETIDIGGNTIFTTEAGLRQLVDAINARLAELEAGA